MSSIDWIAVESIATIVIVAFTAIGLGVSIWSARQANNTAAAAIENANSRAEQDLYRDTLVKIAEWLAISTGSQNTEEQSVARMKAKTLVSMLPADTFPLPATRTHLGADGAPTTYQRPPSPPDEAYDQLAPIRREIAAALAQLHNRSFIIQMSAQVHGKATTSATIETVVIKSNDEA